MRLSNDVVWCCAFSTSNTTSDLKIIGDLHRNYKKTFEKNNFKLAYINANDQNRQFMFLQLDIKKILKFKLDKKNE